MIREEKMGFFNRVKELRRERRAQQNKKKHAKRIAELRAGIMLSLVLCLCFSCALQAAPTTNYFELGTQQEFQINGGGAYGYSSYYGFSQSKTGEETYDRLFGTKPNWPAYVGDTRADTGYQYAHNPADMVHIDSVGELSWIMANLDMSGTVIFDQSDLQNPTSYYGFILPDSIALANAAAQLANLTDMRTGTGYATLLVPVGLETWELRDSQQYGYTLYEYAGEAGLTSIVDPSGLHSVIGYTAPVPVVPAVPAPSALLLAAIGAPIVGWLRRRKTI